MSITKIEFIQQNFPEIKDIDPRFDQYFVRKVARALYENNFYKTYGEGIEFAVCNLIMKAKGTFKKRQVYKTTKVVNMKKP